MRKITHAVFLSHKRAERIMLSDQPLEEDSLVRAAELAEILGDILVLLQLCDNDRVRRQRF